MYILNLQERNYILNLSEKKNLIKIAGLFYTFLTMSDEGKKHVALIEKIQEAKIMMQVSSSDNCVLVYDIKILNLFDPKLLLINTKLVIKNKLKDLLMN